MSAKPNEIKLIRVYDAPLSLVWEVWTDLKHIHQWWGPRGFTLTTKSKELRTGGKWIYTMHGPDGTDWPNIATYHEVIPFKKLVYDHGGNEERPKLFTVTVLFAEANGRTTLDMTMSFGSAEEAKASKAFIKQASGNSTWDRLGEHLAQVGEHKDLFVINRSFAADRKTVFSMWADPVHLGKWLPPTGATMKFLTTDASEGDRARYEMTMPDGQLIYGELHFHQVRPHDLLVYTQYFCDPQGNLIKPAFAPVWPDRIRAVVTFADEPDGETRACVAWEIEGAASDAERKAFTEGRTGMTGGWNGSFDKLDLLLGA